ncbi:MAG: Rhomboid protease GluP [Chlamydiae bacterium]|nr:Rhomboid protease GluP [Chlamydiota bacterium]
MITLILIGLNVLIFILTVISDPAFLLTPSIQAIVQWGGLEVDLVMAGEWWRLISSMFIHLGAIHLLANMYALYTIGFFLESIVGRVVFLTTYLTTGILSGLWSFLMHQDTFYVSAGASGAIAGIFGAYIFILLTPMIPKASRDKLLKNVGYIIAVNIGYGATKGMNIDHAAHLGGLISGLCIAGIFYLFFYLWSQKFKTIKKMWLRWGSMTAVFVLTLVVSFSTLYNRQFSDYAIFSKLTKEFGDVEKEMWKDLNELPLCQSTPQALTKFETNITHKMQSLRRIKEAMVLLQLQGKKDNLRNYLIDYMHLFDQEFHFTQLSLQEDTLKYKSEIIEIGKKITQLRQSFDASFKSH